MQVSPHNFANVATLLSFFSSEKDENSWVNSSFSKCSQLSRHGFTLFVNNPPLRVPSKLLLFSFFLRSCRNICIRKHRRASRFFHSLINRVTDGMDGEFTYEGLLRQGITSTLAPLTSLLPRKQMQSTYTGSRGQSSDHSSRKARQSRTSVLTEARKASWSLINGNHASTL